LPKGQVVLEILRDSQLSLAFDSESHPKDIEGFIIEDNGIGFNDTNMQSFETLDSDHKIEKGGRGVGRLLWLKAFDYVEINSSFEDSKGNLRFRAITFDAQNGVKSRVTTDNSITDIRTLVRLKGFDKKYKDSALKSVDSIAHALLEHCLWYFVRPEGIPIIKIKDADIIINLNDLYDTYMHESAYGETITIKDRNFDLTHIKFRASSSKKHSLALCAASRLVIEEGISGKIPGLYGRISDARGEFVYSCYVASQYLDDRVRSERTAFDIAEDVDGLFSGTEISLKDIREGVLKSSRKYLQDYLEENMEAGRNRVNKFISEKAPRYRPIIPHIGEEELAIDPKISDKDLELHLHKHLAEVERKLLEQGHEIMSSFDGDFDDYKERLSTYLRTAEDIKKSDLANYVSHRRVILDLLERSIQKTEMGQYVREDIIHELIMPMRRDSNDMLFDSYNLWLVDERLTFHNYLASDKTLKAMPITGDRSNKEPDLCALNVYDNPILISDKKTLPLASITVIEIKRPMRNDAGTGEEKYPIEQAIGYLNRIRKGQVKTATGRPIPNSEDIPGYCYVISDLTNSIIERCKIFDLTVASDHMGYFGFHKEFKAYIEVISYDKLVKAAKERNKAFFDKLGLPTS